MGGLGVVNQQLHSQKKNLLPGENNRVAVLGGGGVCVVLMTTDVGMASHWETVSTE